GLEKLSGRVGGSRAHATCRTRECRRAARAEWLRQEHDCADDRWVVATQSRKHPMAGHRYSAATDRIPGGGWIYPGRTAPLWVSLSVGIPGSDRRPPRDTTGNADQTHQSISRDLRPRHRPARPSLRVLEGDAPESPHRACTDPRP